jgi:hypothetical protein
MFQTKVVEKVKTRSMFENFFFFKIVPFMTCGKILQSRTGHRWQHSTARAHCMLDN